MNSIGNAIRNCFPCRDRRAASPEPSSFSSSSSSRSSFSSSPRAVTTAPAAAGHPSESVREWVRQQAPVSRANTVPAWGDPSADSVKHIRRPGGHETPKDMQLAEEARHRFNIERKKKTAEIQLAKCERIVVDVRERIKNNEPVHDGVLTVGMRQQYNAYKGPVPNAFDSSNVIVDTNGLRVHRNADGVTAPNPPRPALRKNALTTIAISDHKEVKQGLRSDSDSALALRSEPQLSGIDEGSEDGSELSAV